VSTGKYPSISIDIERNNIYIMPPY